MTINRKWFSWPEDVINWLFYRYIDNTDLAPTWRWWFAWRPVRLEHPNSDKIFWLGWCLRRDKTNRFGLFGKLRYYKLDPKLGGSDG